MQADRAVVLRLLYERFGTARLSQLLFDACEHLYWHLPSIFVVVGILASVLFGDEPTPAPLLLHKEH